MLTINETHIKNVAKQIGILSTENKCDIKHTKILDAIAIGLGYKSYNALKPQLSLPESKTKENSMTMPTTEFSMTSTEVEYDTSSLSFNETWFTKLEFYITSISSGVRQVEIKEINEWLFTDLRAGLHWLSKVCDGKLTLKRRLNKNELKVFIFKCFLTDVVDSADIWHLIKWPIDWDTGAFFQIDVTDEYLQNLIDHNLLYDNTLLELLKMSEKDFLRSIEHARQEDRNMLTHDYKSW
jgi:hypothetical protein